MHVYPQDDHGESVSFMQLTDLSRANPELLSSCIESLRMFSRTSDDHAHPVSFHTSTPHSMIEDFSCTQRSTPTILSGLSLSSTHRAEARFFIFLNRRPETTLQTPTSPTVPR